MSGNEVIDNSPQTDLPDLKGLSLTRELSESTESSDRVQDTKLNALVTPTQTEHIFGQAGPRETWLRESRLGQGSFGTVWLERCDRPFRTDLPQLRAVKEIRLQSAANSKVDYTRELEAFAKFSQPKVNHLLDIHATR
jgi:hypothetical protein